jgi:putative transposase
MTLKSGSNTRHSTRLDRYNYSLPGVYFVTIVTYRRECLFGGVIDDNMVLSIYGTVAYREWFKSSEIRQEIGLHENEFVIMPNHIHGIVWITHGESSHEVEATDRLHSTANYPGLGVRAHCRAPLRDQHEDRPDP